MVKAAAYAAADGLRRVLAPAIADVHGHLLAVRAEPQIAPQLMLA